MNKLSVLEYYFKYNRVPYNIEFNTKDGIQRRDEHLEKTPFKKGDKLHHNKEKSSNSLKVLEFDVKLPGTSIMIKKKLPYVQVTNDYEMNHWLTSFEEIKEFASWSDLKAIHVLKELFKDSELNLKRNSKLFRHQKSYYPPYLSKTTC